jgi:hypothetical protein
VAEELDWVKGISIDIAICLKRPSRNQEEIHKMCQNPTITGWIWTLEILLFRIELYWYSAMN